METSQIEALDVMVGLCDVVIEAAKNGIIDGKTAEEHLLIYFTECNRIIGVNTQVTSPTEPQGHP